MILSAAYMLWMFQRVNYGPVTARRIAALPDLTPREWVVLVPVVAMAVLMGVLPNLFLRPMEPSVERMLERRCVAGTRIRVQARYRQCRRRRWCRPRRPLRTEAVMNMRSLHAIVPMLCVVAAAIAAMVGRGVPRRQASGCRSARSASSGWSAPASRPSLLWDRHAASFGVVVADNFGAVRHLDV